MASGFIRSCAAHCKALFHKEGSQAGIFRDLLENLEGLMAATLTMRRWEINAGIPHQVTGAEVSVGRLRLPEFASLVCRPAGVHLSGVNRSFFTVRLRTFGSQDSKTLGVIPLRILKNDKGLSPITDSTLRHY
ncbi:hypothetical protein EYF80_043007 [Liparis tanakae]|uniref:Uncharacterized protein n=1 Tax=Liparis tanakae TaxID=230148 RepID=A0A4Z2FZP5_9TELE|nr:hypothetical protein EYF80_043007 [Liparis tanakae]